jgi:hypothetical protein
MKGFESSDVAVICFQGRAIPWITNPTSAAAVDIIGLLIIGASLSALTFLSCSVLRWVFVLRFEPNSDTVGTRDVGLFIQLYSSLT